MQPVIAFNTANFVAYFSHHQFQLSKWGDQHKLTAERIDAAPFTDMCRAIRAAGFKAVEVWVALVEKCGTDAARGEQFKSILRDHNLTPIALAGTLNDTTVPVCRALGIPACAGGYWGSDHATVVRLSRETGIRFNYENHPEKSVTEIREKVNYGADGLAVAVDTGWLGTHHLDAPRTVRELGRLVRHVHLKDVAATGGHETVKLGTGCIDIPGVISELKRIGYDGALSWEDEPEPRNPMDIAGEMHEYIRTQWGRL